MPKLTRVSTKDHNWINKNFTSLVNNHAGKFLVVADGEAFIGRNAAVLFKKARTKHPHTVPTCMPIPRKRDFLSVLCLP